MSEVDARIAKLIKALDDMCDAACMPRLADRLSKDDFELWMKNHREHFTKVIANEKCKTS